MPDSLLQQLLHRIAIFKNNFPNISQAAIAKYCNVEESNLSAAIAGKRGLSGDTVCRLHTLFNLSKRDVLALFAKPTPSCRIMNLTENGKAMRLANDGWVSREGGSADPVDSTSIDQTRKASTAQAVANVISVLGRLDGLTRKTVLDAIAKAYPNPNGTTPSNGQRFSRR